MIHDNIDPIYIALLECASPEDWPKLALIIEPLERRKTLLNRTDVPPLTTVIQLMLEGHTVESARAHVVEVRRQEKLKQIEMECMKHESLGKLLVEQYAAQYSGLTMGDVGKWEPVLLDQLKGF